jgi:hypothetical protein
MAKKIEGTLLGLNEGRNQLENEIHGHEGDDKTRPVIPGRGEKLSANQGD